MQQKYADVMPLAEAMAGIDLKRLPRRLADVAERKRLWDGGKAAVLASKDRMIQLALAIDDDGRKLRARYENEIQSVLTQSSELVARARALLDEVVRRYYRQDLAGTLAGRALRSVTRLRWTLAKGYGTPEGLRDLIRYYTREAGVRNLERELANLARKATKEILLDDKKRIRISRRNLDKYAGVRKFRYGLAEQQDQIGQVTGLAWTQVGGELLTIEAAVVGPETRCQEEPNSAATMAGIIAA